MWISGRVGAFALLVGCCSCGAHRPGPFVITDVVQVGDGAISVTRCELEGDRVLHCQNEFVIVSRPTRPPSELLPSPLDCGAGPSAHLERRRDPP
jgi:hypothetical protein